MRMRVRVQRRAHISFVRTEHEVKNARSENVRMDMKMQSLTCAHVHTLIQIHRAIKRARRVDSRHNGSTDCGGDNKSATEGEARGVRGGGVGG